MTTAGLGLRYPMAMTLVGDSKLTLQGLLPQADLSWRQRIEANVHRW